MVWSPMTGKQFEEDVERLKSQGPWYPNEKEAIDETLTMMPNFLESPRVPEL